MKRMIYAFSLAAIAVLHSGCATPSEIKTASHAQLELLRALDDSTLALQEGLSQYHGGEGVRIRQEGRMLIARQAINVAATDTNAATADGLFETSNKKVRPWVDYAFAEPDIDAAIKKTADRQNQTTNSLLKLSLQNDLEDLQLLKAALSQKPKDVQEIEAIILSDLNQEKKASEDVSNSLRLLKAQVALMKAMATTIDNWLTIDVTVTQAQADALKKAFSEAQGALGGGK